MKISLFRLALPALTSATRACDPGETIQVQSTLRPVPVTGCIDSTVSASPLVSEVTSGDGRPLVILRDAPPETPGGTMWVRALGDSAAQLSLGFLWIPNVYNLPDSTQRWIARQATILMIAIRAACAPESPDDMNCKSFTFLRTRSCLR